RTLDEGPGDGKALSLPTRHVAAALRDRRVEALRHRSYEVLRLRHLERTPHLLFCCFRSSVAQVARHRACEEVRLLRDQTDTLPQRVRLVVTHIDAFDEHSPGSSVEQARDQVDERGLACAGRPDDGDGLTRTDGEAYVLEDSVRRPRIREADPRELDPAGQRATGDACDRRNYGRVRLEHLAYALSRHGGTRQQHGQHRRHQQRDEYLQQVTEVGRQRAYLHLTVVYPDAAEPQYSYRREIENQQHQGEQGRHPATDEEAHVGEFTVGLTEPRLLMRLADESPDDADAAGLLSHHLAGPVDALLHLPEAGDHAPDDEPDTACQQRHSNRQRPRQAAVLAQGHEDAADHHDRGRH